MYMQAPKQNKTKQKQLYNHAIATILVIVMNHTQ